MIKYRHLLTLLSIGLAFLLTGCNAALLNPHGVIAASQKSLLIDATLLMLIVVVPVIIITFAFAWHYRESNKKATYRPNDDHSTIIEVVCWTVPCIIIAILATMTWISTHKLDPYRPLESSVKPVTIEVIALQWKWLFIYPEENIATLNYLQIPVDTPINFVMTADAPMNSLEIPQLAGQIYAMTGMKTQLHIMADTVGDYMALSTNISGYGFSDMHFTVHASTPADYQAWVKTIQKSPKHLDLTEYNRLVAPSSKDPVQYYSGVEKDLFENEVMKFMMPMPKYALAIDGSL